MVEKVSLPAIGVALITFLNCSRCYAQFNYAPGDTVYCLKPEGLPLYDQLDRGNVIQRLRYGKRMVVQDKYGEDTFDYIRDHWYKVQTDSAVGYVFGGYLWFMPAPPPGGQIEMYLRRYIPKPRVLSKENLTCAEAPPDKCFKQVLEFTWKGRKIQLTTEYGDHEYIYEAIHFPGLDAEHLLAFVRAAYRNTIEMVVSNILNNPYQQEKEKREQLAREFREALLKPNFTDVGGRRLHVFPNMFSMTGLEQMDVEDLGNGKFIFEYTSIKDL
ncbi:MAG: hypothetical protein N2110_09720 [Flavobacteriales bacterium]|nr:hypothetical protein [Flavobacteriales bacterium]MCX7769280.1 hypothetical protein [Flavobacteriales bacterium]MDW8409995.1 hypothetical protein [Flavobacteriales bacterium]